MKKDYIKIKLRQLCNFITNNDEILMEGCDTFNNDVIITTFITSKYYVIICNSENVITIKKERRI